MRRHKKHCIQSSFVIAWFYITDNTVTDAGYNSAQAVECADGVSEVVTDNAFKTWGSYGFRGAVNAGTIVFNSNAIKGDSVPNEFIKVTNLASNAAVPVDADGNSWDRVSPNFAAIV